MKASKVLLSIILTAFIFSSCKKEDKEPQFTTPVGYFKGTYTIAPQAAQNIFFLIRDNGTVREYSSNTSVDSSTMLKVEKVWLNTSNNLEIRKSDYSGYVFRATLTTPITTIAGQEGIYSLGTFQTNGSFSVSRQ